MTSDSGCVAVTQWSSAWAKFSRGVAVTFRNTSIDQSKGVEKSTFAQWIAPSKILAPRIGQPHRNSTELVQSRRSTAIFDSLDVSAAIFTPHASGQGALHWGALFGTCVLLVV
eukprot:scaffold57_cov254-Pinguiococcus_pyrenoidosus.AAC.21